jgi:hypothetical protein
VVKIPSIASFEMAHFTPVWVYASSSVAGRRRDEDLQTRHCALSARATFGAIALPPQPSRSTRGDRSLHDRPLPPTPGPEA